MLNNKEKKFTINQLAKQTKTNYRIAHKTVKLLEKEDLIKTEKAGNSLLCSLTYNFNEKIFNAEHERRKKFKHLIKRFEEAKQNYILLLFGSYAKNTQTKDSDIDLLAITENKKEIEEIAELIPKNIHLTTVNYKLFLDMIKSKEINVGNEVLKNNIILIGIEDYYRLIKNGL